MRRDAALVEIIAEIEEAQSKFPPFNSAHEGYAVILEEVRELESEVFFGRKDRSDGAWVRRMNGEAIQIAAMCLRFLCEIEGRYFGEEPGEGDGGDGNE